LWTRLRAIDAAPPPDERVLELLRALPMFAPLAPPALERLALDAERLEVQAGAVVLAQGEPGDRCYVIDRGTAQVAIDGRDVRVQGPGSMFGEIALLRDVPRTATVVAREPLVLWALERHAFLGALGASPEASEGAEHLAMARLSYARPAIGLP
jgi:CRP-like cAMP-binding protein